MNKRNNGKERWLIKKCKEDIKRKFAGNTIINFTHSDFEKLTEAIYEHTNILISISTLKRIWKESYEGSPSKSTLDAFAKYLGFGNWRDYCNDYYSKQTKGFILLRDAVLVYQRPLIYSLGILVVFTFLFFLFLKSDRFYNPDYDGIEFVFQEFDSTQIPVNAVFKYNLKDIKCDSARIRPLGNSDEEFVISTSDSIATYIYVRPWLYYPSLIIDGKVVKSLKTNFVSGTWKAALSNTRNIFYIKYFDDPEIFINGKLNFTDELLIRNNFPLDNIEYVTYDLFKKFDNISGDNLCFETNVRNKVIVREEGSGNINVALCFQESFILVPFSIEKSPYAPLSATFFNHNISSKNNNLSFLYMNLEEWNTIKIITRNKHLYLYTNDSVVFSIDYHFEPGKLIGVMFDFKGLGEVDFVRFYDNDNNLVYNDEFD